MRLQNVLKLTLVLLTAFLVFHFVVVRPLPDEIAALETIRVKKSNDLLGAKIVSENLSRVSRLINANMDIELDTSQTTRRWRRYARTVFYDFVTECLNDLKIPLTNFDQLPIQAQAGANSESYKLEVLSDFFRFGELATKFENSEKIISLDRFDVVKRAAEFENGDQLRRMDSSGVGPKDNLQVTLEIKTFQILKKGAAAPVGEKQVRR